MAGRSEVEIARKTLGAVLSIVVAASIVGGLPLGLIAPLPPIKVFAAVANPLNATNVSAINTSRDGAPFNGAIYYNTSVLVNVTLTTPLDPGAFPYLTLNISILPPDMSYIKATCNVTAWPSVTGVASVLVYNFTMIINNSGIFIGQNIDPVSGRLINGVQLSSPWCYPGTVSLSGSDIGDIIVFHSPLSFSPAFKELVFNHTAASSVSGVPTSITPANLSTIPLSGTFSFVAPDLNKFWNAVDNNTNVYIAIGNDTIGYLLTNRIGVNETGSNTGVFQNSTITTMAVLLNATAIIGTALYNATTGGLNTGSYNITILVPKYNGTALTFTPPVSSFTFGSDVTGNFDIINISLSVGVPPPVQIIVDRPFIPATVDYNISVNVTIVDSSLGMAPAFGGSGPGNVTAVFLNYLGQPVKTNVPLPMLFTTTTPVQIGPFTWSFYITINGPLAFQYPYEVLGGKLRISYYSPALGWVSQDIPIKAVDVTMTINGSSSVQANFGQAVVLTVINPAANVNTSAVDTLNVTVIGASQSEVTLYETGPNTSVFEAVLWIGLDGNISPTERTVTFVYIHNTSSTTPPDSTRWASSELKVSLVMLPPAPMIVSPIDGLKTGPVGVLNVTIVDPSQNLHIYSADTVSFTIRRWDGSTITLTATETGANTGVFTAVIDKSIIGTPRDLLLGGVAEILYAGLSVKVYFVSMDGIVTLDKPFYLPGQQIVITVNDTDAVRDPSIVESIRVRVTSTSDPIGIEVVLNETGPGTGIFVGSVLVSNNTLDRGKPGIIYANIGDTITVTYTDQFPADYAQTGRSKDITKTALVGQLLEKPISFGKVSITTLDGTPVVNPVAGRTVLFMYNATNNNPVPTTVTFLFQVLDSRGTPLFFHFVVVTIPAGQTFTLIESYTFPAPDTYTVRIMAVKSFTDLTPLSDKVELTVTVVSG